MVNSALELSKITSEDPFAGIPEPSQLGKLEGDLDLYYEDVYSLPTPIASTTRAGLRKLRSTPIRASPTPKAGSSTPPSATRCLANSHGFIGDYRRSYCSVSAVPIAQIEGAAMQRDYWYSVANTLKKLESPERSGKSPPNARCGGWAHAKSRPRKCPSSSSTRSPRSLLETYL